jgi:cytidylate kinase
MMANLHLSIAEREKELLDSGRDNSLIKCVGEAIVLAHAGRLATWLIKWEAHYADLEVYYEATGVRLIV